MGEVEGDPDVEEGRVENVDEPLVDEYLADLEADIDKHFD